MVAIWLDAAGKGGPESDTTSSLSISRGEDTPPFMAPANEHAVAESGYCSIAWLSAHCKSIKGSALN